MDERTNHRSGGWGGDLILLAGAEIQLDMTNYEVDSKSDSYCKILRVRRDQNEINALSMEKRDKCAKI